MSLYDKVSGKRQMTMQDIMLDPVGAGKEAGYNVPPNLAGNPQAIFQHLLQTGQITNPMMQKLMPMMQRMGLK